MDRAQIWDSCYIIWWLTAPLQTSIDFIAFRISCVLHIIGNLIYCLMPIWPMANSVFGDIQSQQLWMTCSEFLVDDADMWSESEANIYRSWWNLSFMHWDMFWYTHGQNAYTSSHEKRHVFMQHTVYASQTDNACSRLFVVPSLWTVTHQLNLSPLTFPCTPSHLPSSSLPNKGVTKMTKDSPQNEMQHQAENNTRIQFHPKTNILQSIALYRSYLSVFHPFWRLKASG